MPKKILTEQELRLTAKAVDLHLYMNDKKMAEKMANKVPKSQKKEFMLLFKNEAIKTLGMIYKLR